MSDSAANKGSSEFRGAHGQPTCWHVRTVEEVADILGVGVGRVTGNSTDAPTGLRTEQVLERRQRFGINTLGETPRRSILAGIMAQFANIIVALLLSAASVAFVLGDLIEGFAILFVIIVNAAIGFFMEWRAEKALLALRGEVVPTAHVVRDGGEHRIPAAELVPGDLVVLSAGDRVPADGRIVEAVRLHAIESALTGESVPISKVSEAIADREVPLGDRTNMVFMGTSIADGRGRYLVTETGASTQFGQIGQMLGAISNEISPLERKLRHLGNTLVIVVIGLCTVITIGGWYRGNDFLQMLEVGISLAIAAVPEGLPAVATMALALGMQRMAKMKAVIRRLPAVETLGSTTIVCTDKTGTLTKNEMTVCSLQLGSRRIDVTGSGYLPEGLFLEEGRTVDPGGDNHLTHALKLGMLCNDAGINGSGEVFGDPTEVALIVAGLKAGVDHERLLDEHPRFREVPFSSDTKRMATYHAASSQRGLIAVKGAVSALLGASSSVWTAHGVEPISDVKRAEILAWNNEMAGRALRVLGVAEKRIENPHEESDINAGLTFVALVGMLDPLRDEAREAVARCHEAGIRVVMITGDQLLTASEIGNQLGIMQGPKGEPLRTVHGRLLTTQDHISWAETVNDVGVFARVSPEHKLRIVEGFQAAGQIVAMTGDGVNDAPALKRADIGVAMGIKGTEVAKDASDMVITDDNFATIVHAIEQGRIVYANIIRFVHYLFSCNLSEILVISCAIVVGWPLPLAAIQLLWLNMITDIFPALALVFEPSSPGMMQRPPRRPDEPIISGVFARVIIFEASLLCAATLVAFGLGLQLPGNPSDVLRLAGTMAFTTLAFAQTLHALSSRSRQRMIISQSIRSNWWLVGAIVLSILLQLLGIYAPFLQRVLHTSTLIGYELLIVMLCSIAPMIVVEGLKVLFGSAEARNNSALGKGFVG